MEKIGMPASHAAKFNQIAVQENYLILCRSPGPTCCQLLEQGFDTKGFRVHAKSCDWGPMAGYVLRDPRLNKKGASGIEFNREQHQEAIVDTNHAGWKAATTPLKLYPARVRWLQRQGLIHITPVGRDSNRYTGVARHSTGISFQYVLIYEQVGGQNVWGVYLDNKATPRLHPQEVGVARRYYYQQGRFGTQYEAMLAMTNPIGYTSWPTGDFRNAITGDYDLFALWPTVAAYDHSGKDRRILGTASALTDGRAIDHMEHNFTEVDDHHQATKIGNITDRLYELCQLLNSAIGGAVSPNSVPSGPFPERMVCWHSDEAARPGVTDVDLPMIAFAPSGLEIGVETMADFKELVDVALVAGFKVNLAEGWTSHAKAKPNQLGPDYLPLVPSWRPPGQPAPMLKIPAWYNS
ncbi:MAG: anthrax toxin-like adenylyl cyclase domain-containing protein [Acidobacteria bacterium]|nr:anthrax toxin-like adenylyl cyclase domain-containing protein [Acidobacteriota bacterium]